MILNPPVTRCRHCFGTIDRQALAAELREHDIPSVADADAFGLRV
jgi:hypothetical protein